MIYLKIGKKKDLRTRTRKTELMLNDLHLAITSLISSSLPSRLSHPEDYSMIVPCFFLFIMSIKFITEIRIICIKKIRTCHLKQLYWVGDLRCHLVTFLRQWMQEIF